MAENGVISPDVIEVSVTYGTTYKFFLEEIGMAEEQKLRQKRFGLTEAEREEKEYDLNVQLLKDLSVKKPIGLFPDKPKATAADDQTVYVDDLGAAEAIERFFAERTPRKERIAFYAVSAYFVRLIPSESFF